MVRSHQKRKSARMGHSPPIPQEARKVGSKIAGGGAATWSRNEDEVSRPYKNTMLRPLELSLFRFKIGIKGPVEKGGGRMTDSGRRGGLFNLSQGVGKTRPR